MERREGKKRLAVLTVLLALAVSILLTGCKSGTGESVDWKNLEDIAGTVWYAGDSRVDFDDQGNFTWYTVSSDLEHNYLTGTYDFYFKEDAIKYITEDMNKGFTREGLEEVVSKNRDLKMENICAVAFHFEDDNLDAEAQKSWQLNQDTIVNGTMNTYGFFILRNQYMYLVNVEDGRYYKFRH